MHPKILFPVLLLFFAGITPVYARSAQEQVRAYRADAAEHFTRGHREEALKYLGYARAEVKHIRDNYTRENMLRYIAEEYAKYGFVGEAHALFAEAMDEALQTTPWYRKQSSVIGVLELQKTTNDKNSLHQNALKALAGGMLEEADTAGKAGELGRFFTAIQSVLTTADIRALLARVKSIKTTEIRVKTLYQLSQMEWAEVPIAGEEAAEDLRNPHEKAAPLEQVLWRCIAARLYTHYGMEEHATQQLNQVDELVRTMKDHRDTAEAIFTETKKKLEKPLPVE